MGHGIEAVLSVLETAAFQRLPGPLTVAGSAFDFDAVVKGTGVSNDLVIVAMSPTEPRRLVRLVSGLTRTLDQVASRRPVTLVLLGKPLDVSTLTELERHARVLSIGNADPGLDEVRRAVAVLLPLTLPSTTNRGSDPLTEVANELGPSLSNEHQAFIEAAKVGPDAVQESLRRYIDAAVLGDSERIVS